MNKMNKTLILVRHSKAENRHSSLNDFDRSLTEEGKSDTMKMGNLLFNSGTVPDFILTSSAVRAYETASTFAHIFKTNIQNIKSTRTLYYCSAKTLLDQIYGLPETISCLLVVAHNPGISDLNRRLSGGKSFYMDNTQVTFLTYDVKHWFQIGDVKPIKFESFSVKDIA
jgi:phosphohistidine phosphatase